MKSLLARSWELAASPTPAGHLFTHDPREHPSDCLDAVLHELAFEANLTGERCRATFEHGEDAAGELQRQVEEARAWARGQHHTTLVLDTDNPPEWLTAPPVPTDKDDFEFPPEAELRPGRPSMAPTGPPQVRARLLDADLNQEDDDGHGWTLVDLASFDASWLFPGAVINAGRKGGHGRVTVLGTQLFDTTAREKVVLVTFDKGR